MVPPCVCALAGYLRSDFVCGGRPPAAPSL